MEVGSASEARSFGKYTLVAKLAMGGMAEIFLARLHGDGGFEKLVCIKRILPHLAKDPQFVAMFLDEARVAARISHPNVCQVFELGEYEGQYYIAMEYLQGVPLSCFRRTDFYPGLPDPRLVAGIGVQACEGLHHAHNLKRSNGELLEVVHRDVSPQNLFVTVDGIVKVLDFGIAKVQDASIKTSTGAVKGTYAYMSPEQLRGEGIDRRADVFAMGIVLWESLAQRHLFKRDTDFLTFQAIMNEPIPDICELRPDVPPLLGDALSRAIARNREDRIPSARALGEAIAQAVAPLGGVLAPSAIGEEVEEAFADMLAEQQTLISVVRGGGAFDLDSESDMIGHGTQMSTTPVSNIRKKVDAARDQVAEHAQAAIAAIEAEATPLPLPRPPSAPRKSAPVPSQPPIDPHSQPYAVAPREWRSQEFEAAAPPPPRPPTQIATRPSSRLPWIVALVAIVIAAGTAVMLFMGQRQKKAAVASPTVPSESQVVSMHSNAPMPMIDAAAEQVVADAAEAAPPDAATAITKPNVVTPHTDKHPPKQPPKPIVVERPSGPPGFITIDSAPVYAVIFIDGKKYGETPLVHLSLSPGKHSVRAVSASGTTRNLSIAIESGKTAPVRRIEW